MAPLRIAAAPIGQFVAGCAVNFRSGLAYVTNFDGYDPALNVIGRQPGTLTDPAHGDLPYAELSRRFSTAVFKPGDSSGMPVDSYAESVRLGTFAGPKSVDVTVTAAVPDPRMAIDTPETDSTPVQPFSLAGWAIDLGATGGTGVDAIHVWAFHATTGAASFLGVATYGTPRPDVGAVFCGSFTNSGYGLTVSGLPAGVYDVVVYAHSSVAQSFNQAKAVRVSVE